MWAKPTKKDFQNFPKLYSTENVRLKDKLIVGHFFVGPADWYVVEYDPIEKMFFGYVNLGNIEMAEWGYFSFTELESLKVNGMLEVDYDKHWTVKKASEIDKINV